MVLLAPEGVRTESVNWEAAGATVRLAGDCAHRLCALPHRQGEGRMQ
jgi:hypothetical protein